MTPDRCIDVPCSFVPTLDEDDLPILDEHGYAEGSYDCSTEGVEDFFTSNTYFETPKDK